MVGWKSFSGNEFKDRWTSKRFNLELSDLCPELGWYVLRYGDKYYKNMPPKIPDLELVLLSNSDKWEDSSMSGRSSLDIDNFLLNNKINEISARLPGYLSGGITYNYDRP